MVMCPRPRAASDEAILAATARAMTRLGPTRLTLADVAREVGLSPAALVQRFGSKRGLLLAIASRAPEGNAQIFEGLHRAHRSPIARLLALADCMSELGRTPEEISNSLAFLQIDLTDPEFHRSALAASRGIHAGITRLVAEAIRAGALVRCDPGRLARTLQATLNGSLLNWAIHRKGSLRNWIRRDIETLLRHYARPKAQGSRHKAGRLRA
jgi:AcrR family transcriptional regulator